MTDRPIPFSGPMVQALLDGRKTQTRRLLKPQPIEKSAPSWSDEKWWAGPQMHPDASGACESVFRVKAADGRYMKMPWSVGDRLCVKEAHWAWGHWELTGDRTRKLNRPKWRFVRDHNTPVRFKAPDQVPPDRSHLGWHKRPGMFMFRRDTRLTLTVTDVRVQRVQEIYEHEALLEGVRQFRDTETNEPYFLTDGQRSGWSTAKQSFSELWNSLNTSRGYGWDENPWVSATTFTVHRCNIDQIESAA